MDAPLPPSIDGKKVFFVQPNSVIQKEMVADLIRLEYEVLLIPEARQARKIFKLYPNCLAFLNIDEGLTEKEWADFVRDIQADPTFSGVKLGILTYNSDPALQRKYLMDLMVPCGFIRLTLRLTESTAIVAKVLEANEARGRRKYLRVHCGENTRLNVRTAKGLIEGRIIDLSSVGMACVLKSSHEIKVHSVLDSIQLQLKGSLCLINGVVMGSRPTGDGSENAYVVLFDPKTSGAQKEKIRTYLLLALQDKIDTILRAKDVQPQASRV